MAYGKLRNGLRITLIVSSIFALTLAIIWCFLEFAIVGCGADFIGNLLVGRFDVREMCVYILSESSRTLRVLGAVLTFVYSVGVCNKKSGKRIVGLSMLFYAVHMILFIFVSAFVWKEPISALGILAVLGCVIAHFLFAVYVFREMNGAVIPILSISLTVFGGVVVLIEDVNRYGIVALSRQLFLYSGFILVFLLVVIAEMTRLAPESKPVPAEHKLPDNSFSIEK